MSHLARRIYPMLRPGQRVRVVAPAGPFDADAFHRGVRRLQQRYDVRFEEQIFSTRGYLAGSDERRLFELQAALADPEAKAIVAARGGYGSTRLLPQLDVEMVRRAAKLLVGFSDITALHCLWHRAGVASVHGPMVAWLGRREAADDEFERWQRVVEGEPPESHALEVWVPGRAEGLLVGGNLAVLHALIGTPFAPNLTGCVLLLEDVGERPYRIDRMLTTLRQSGLLSGVAAVVLGHFTNCESPRDPVSAVQVLKERLCDLGIPVAAGLPVGHGSNNHPIPLGRTAMLADGQLSFPSSSESGGMVG